MGSSVNVFVKGDKEVEKLNQALEERKQQNRERREKEKQITGPVPEDARFVSIRF